jgi:alkaline phosphatase
MKFGTILAIALAAMIFTSMSLGGAAPYKIGGDSARHLQKAIKIGQFPDTDNDLIEANAAAREAQSKRLIDTAWKQDEQVDPTRENMENIFDDSSSMDGANERQAQIRAEEEKTTVHHYGDQKHVFNSGPSARYRKG